MRAEEVGDQLVAAGDERRKEPLIAEPTSPSGRAVAPPTAPAAQPSRVERVSERSRGLDRPEAVTGSGMAMEGEASAWEWTVEQVS